MQKIRGIFILSILIVISGINLVGQNNGPDEFRLNLLNKESLKKYAEGDFETAVKLAQEVLDLSTKIYGKDSGSTSVAALNLAEMLVARRKLDLAIGNYLLALEIHRSTAPNNVEGIRRIVDRLARALALDGRRAEAENQYLSNLASIEKQFGQDDIRTFPFVRSVAKYYDFAGEAEKANDYFLRQYRILWLSKADSKAERERLDDEHVCFETLSLNKDQRQNARERFSKAFYDIFPDKKKEYADASLSKNVVNGKAISLKQPEYPSAAKVSRTRGSVLVRVTINESGDVVDAKAICGDPVFRSAVVNAAMRSRFSQTLLSGQPVKVSGYITYNFQ